MKHRKILSLLLTAALFVSMSGQVFAANVSDSDIASEQTVVASEKESDDASSVSEEPEVSFVPEGERVTVSEQVRNAEEGAATSGTCGENLTWKFDESSGTLTISGSGAMKDFNMYSAPWYGLDIRTVKFSGNITSIGDFAFGGCENLKDITLPDSVKSIGSYSFYRCFGISGLTLPKNLETIGMRAFYNCYSFTSMRIPASVKIVGAQAFIYCFRLEKISVDSANTEYCDSAGVLYDRKMTELVKVPYRWGSSFNVPASVGYIYTDALNSSQLEHVFVENPNVTISDVSDVFDSGTVLHGPANSTLQAYAEKYGLTFKAVTAYSGPVLSDYKMVAAKATASNNMGKHNYTGYRNAWGRVANSYLYNYNGTLTRVEQINSELIVENYSSDFTLKTAKTVALELPVFGGFFAGSQYNFVVSGQNNLDESNSVEVVRVTKYDKSWNRLGSKSFYGENTYIPFDAGTVSMAEDGDNLYIHTAHEMYQSSDGLHHQSNMSFFVNKESLNTVYSRSNVWNISTGYVSHSFNQYIRTDGGYVYTADHGDAHPRSVVLVKKTTTGGNVGSCDVLALQGTTGDNETKATVGGLELSSSSAIVVGSSVTQDAEYASRTQKNIFLTVTPKTNLSSGATSLTWLTHYAEGANMTVSNPYLVKVSDNRLIVMWEESDSDANKYLKCQAINASGQTVGSVVTVKEAYYSEGLSDCAPIVVGDGIVWYGASGSVDFYRIPTDLNLTEAAKLVKVSSVAVKSKPTKLTYNAGETFNASGMTLTVKYTNGTSKEITGGYTCTPSGKLTAVGQQKIVVSYGGMSTGFYVTVKETEKTISSIAISQKPTKLSYKVGETFDASGMKLKITYSNSTTAEITSGYTCTPSGKLTTAGQQKIVVSYGGKSTGFYVTVNKEITSITIKKKPTKQVYLVGESFNASGMTVRIHYSDNSTADVTSGFTYTPSRLSTAGQQKIVVSLGGKSTGFYVTVNKANQSVSSVTVKKLPTKKVYGAGESFSSAGMVLKVTYSDNTTAEVTGGFTCTPSGKLNTVGQQKIVVSFGGKSTGFYVTVDKAVSSVAIRKKPTKLTYNTGESLNTSGMTLKVSYADGTTKEITGGFTCTPTALTTVGQQKVVVSYGGKSTGFYVTVNKVISSVTIKKLPTKRTYQVGETFNSSGMVLKVTYSDGATKETSVGFLCTPSGKLNAKGQQKIVVSFGGKSTGFYVTVA